MESVKGMGQSASPVPQVSYQPYKVTVDVTKWYDCQANGRPLRPKHATGASPVS